MYANITRRNPATLTGAGLRGYYCRRGQLGESGKEHAKIEREILGELDKGQGQRK